MGHLSWLNKIFRDYWIKYSQNCTKDDLRIKVILWNKGERLRNLQWFLRTHLPLVPKTPLWTESLVLTFPLLAFVNMFDCTVHMYYCYDEIGAWEIYQQPICKYFALWKLSTIPEIITIAKQCIHSIWCTVVVREWLWRRMYGNNTV